MKKSFTKVLLAAAMFCVSSGASAYDFEADGIYYNILSEAGKTVEVTSGENKYFGDVSIPVTVENGGMAYTVTKIGEDAFYECSGLVSIDIPDGVVSIGGGAFMDCSSLESVTFGRGLETIGEAAFCYCYNLASIDIPDGVTSIGDEAFAACRSLAEITSRAVVPPVCGLGCFADVDKSNCTLSVPEGAEEAYKTADGWKEFFYEYFMSGGIKYGVSTLSQGNIAVVVAGGDYTGDIAIPATVENGRITYTVTAIGDGAFANCSDLASVDIPDGVTSIGAYAFTFCSSLASVNIPDGVVSISEGVFNCCSSLASIDIPDGVTSIGDDAFFNCNTLESVTLGSGLEAIGRGAFSDCSDLVSVDIPDGVTSIGDYAFYECSGLESVTLGSGLETIVDYAFYGCRSLAEINSLATLPPVCGAYSFYGVDKTACTLNVPEGTADDYRAANEWKEFFNIVETDFAGSGEIAAYAAVGAKVYAAAGRIVVENAAAGTPIAVYIADGVQVYGGTASGGRTEIPAQAGKLYIVRCGNAAYKTAM